MFQFICPPMPHYITGGEAVYPIGGKHADRSNIGVFDLIVVTRGCLFMEENGETLDISSAASANMQARNQRPFVCSTVQSSRQRN